MAKESVIEEGYRKSIQLLINNSTPLGFSASTEKVSNYYSVWARDHAICSMAASLTGNEQILETAKEGILMMLRKQMDHGQVPSYIEIENRKKVYGGLGSITSVDSNMWVAIAAAALYKKTKDRRFISFTNMARYKKLYRLFKAFDSNDCGLIEMPKAGDWADVFNRSYHVLYVECLYYQALKALQFLIENGLQKIKDNIQLKKYTKRLRWIRNRRSKVKKRINKVFWFTKENIESIRKEYMIFDDIEIKNYPYYQSHLMPFKMHWQNRLDTFGNILAMITNISNKKRNSVIIKNIINNKINLPVPITSLHPTVFKRNIGWESIYSEKEKPHTYHNGGIWPMIGGFWIYCLTKNNLKNTASNELYSLAVHLKKQKWSFHEYLHGKTTKPLGKKNQSWSAAGYIIAYHSCRNEINLFEF